MRKENEGVFVFTFQKVFFNSIFIPQATTTNHTPIIDKRMKEKPIFLFIYYSQKMQTILTLDPFLRAAVDCITQGDKAGLVALLSDPHNTTVSASSYIAFQQNSSNQNYDDDESDDDDGDNSATETNASLRFQLLRRPLLSIAIATCHAHHSAGPTTTTATQTPLPQSCVEVLLSNSGSSSSSLPSSHCCLLSDSFGFTPLHFAVADCTICTKLLLSHCEQSKRRSVLSAPTVTRFIPKSIAVSVLRHCSIFGNNKRFRWLLRQECFSEAAVVFATRRTTAAATAIVGWEEEGGDSNQTKIGAATLTGKKRSRQWLCERDSDDDVDDEEESDDKEEDNQSQLVRSLLHTGQCKCSIAALRELQSQTNNNQNKCTTTSLLHILGRF